MGNKGCYVIKGYLLKRFLDLHVYALKENGTFTGKQVDGYSPRPRELEAFNLDEPAIMYQDPESLIVAMERVTVLFDR